MLEGEEEEGDVSGRRRQENKNPTLRMWGTKQAPPKTTWGDSRTA